MMICSECKEKTHVIYITEKYERLCPKCNDNITDQRDQTVYKEAQERYLKNIGENEND